MPKLEIPRETAVDEYDLPYGGCDEAQIVEDKSVSKSRWHIHHELVVLIDGKYWKTRYLEGATENQDTRPWEYEDAVIFEQVEPVQVLTTVYKKVAEVSQGTPNHAAS